MTLTETEYTQLKEQIKQELIDEWKATPESLTSACRREQSAIFNRYFPDSAFREDQARRWKLRDVCSTMTNLCRQRFRLIINGKVFPVSMRGAAVRSEAELDDAIATFEAVCSFAHSIFREDITPGPEAATSEPEQ